MFPEYDGPIIQKYGNFDHGIEISPWDRRSMIIDCAEQEEPEARRERIWRTVATFLIRVGRLKVNDELNWTQVKDVISKEMEHNVMKNITFDMILPGFDYWSREGKLSRMVIKKPRYASNFDNLDYWRVTLFYDGYEDNEHTTTVLFAMMTDRYIIAWYALWRKWPLQYKVWEWAGRFKEVRDALTPPNSSDYFKNKHKEEEKKPTYKKIKRVPWYPWWEKVHECSWDRPACYSLDPSLEVSGCYPDFADYRNEKFYKEVEEDWLFRRRECNIVELYKKDHYYVVHSDDSDHDPKREFVMEENSSDVDDKMLEY